MPRRKKIVTEALQAAEKEGFSSADSWKERHLLIWYKAYLIWENQPVPKELRGILIDIGTR